MRPNQCIVNLACKDRRPPRHGAARIVRRIACYKHIAILARAAVGAAGAIRPRPRDAPRGSEVILLLLVTFYAGYQSHIKEELIRIWMSTLRFVVS
jgi:hypothetical protein